MPNNINIKNIINNKQMYFTNKKNLEDINMSTLALNFSKTKNNDFAINVAKEVIETLSNGEYDNSTISISDVLDTEILDTLEARLTYNDDQWEMMKLYLNPEGKNFEEALKMCMDEIYTIIEIIDSDRFPENTKSNFINEQVDNRLEDNNMTKLVLKHNYADNNDFAISIAKEVIETLNNEEHDYSSLSMSDELYTEISYVLEAKLIYNDDRWEMMKIYLNPEDANYEEALEMCMDEVHSIIEIIDFSESIEDANTIYFLD